MFPEITHESFDERERRILAFWKKERIFERSVEEKKDQDLFSFYDGPPFATGLPHYGHLLAGTIKDVVPRYKTMKGYFVPRRFGWDCHGLPVENEIEKKFNLSGAKSIEEFGIDKFNEECRKIVLRYTQEWKETVSRMGRWVDFEKTYKTMDLSFMETVWWVFSKLYQEGLVYKGFKVMPYSAKLGTPLSNFEATQNYKDVDDPALTVAFPIDDNTYFLAWTTTPWTLISNLALMVGPEIDYVKVRVGDKFYILAEGRLKEYFKEGEYEIVDRFKGKELEGKKYRPLFDYFKDRNAFRVILEDTVMLDEGTGIVHSAPAFGEVDFYACQKEGIEPVCPVDENGRFTEEIKEYQNLFVKDADKEIIRKLKQEGKVFKHATCRHRYPFCWRSDTPLIYRAVSTWFVKVEAIKEKLIANNEKIHWMPEHIKHGRFGKWLENARDWAISRNRYWGTPIPLWVSDDGDILCLGSIKELEELSGRKINDLHRHFIDDIVIEKDGKSYKRIEEVFDCWFESGSMPYAQNHYPFENKELLEKGFPADFIAEGLDQTRGWFYTLNILSTALFNRPAFKNVIVNGILLAEDGQKMSKRLGNYPDPKEVIHKYGADAIRLYMLNSPAVKADDLRFSEKGVEHVLKQVMIPVWNAFNFFVTYARINKWTAKKLQPKTVLDRWMVSISHRLIKDVEEGMESYDLSKAVGPLVHFIDELTNWFIRRSRRKFWDDEPTEEQDQAFATLYYALNVFVKVAAPFIPFITEAMYQVLKQPEDRLSVHLCAYPKYDENLRDQELEEAMALVQQTVSMGHALRKENKIKVRMPLRRAFVVSSNPRVRKLLREYTDIIAEELNVKEVKIEDKEERYVSLEGKPNFKKLGKRFGKLIKEVQKKIASFDLDTLKKLILGEKVEIEIDNQTHVLEGDDVQVRRIVKEGIVAANEKEITIALETALDKELEEEGLMREIINKLNTMRRDHSLDVTDRIRVWIDSTKKVEKCFEKYGDYIKKEVLATDVFFESNDGVVWDLNGEKAQIKIEKANTR